MKPVHFSFLHLLTTLAGLTITAVSPTVQTALSHHPLLFSIFGSIYAALGVFLPPPTGGGGS